MKKDMTYKVFIDDNLRAYDLFLKTSNPLYKGDIIHCKSYNEFVECVEEKFKKNGSYPGFVSFDYLLTSVTMKITDTYEVHFNDESYIQNGVDCANWLVNFMIKNNLPLPNYIVHDINVRARMSIQKIFNSAKSNIVSDPFTEKTPVIKTPEKTVIETPVIETPVKTVIETPVVIETPEKTVIETPVIETPVIETPEKTPVKMSGFENIGKKEKMSFSQQKYWEELKNYLEKNKSSIKIKKGLPQYWSNFSVGKSDFYISAMINSKEPKNICLEFCFMGKNAKSNFDSMKKLCYDESIIEMNDLFWDRMEGNKMSGIFLRRNGDFLNKNDWENQFKWFMTNLEKMSNFFKPYLNLI